MRPLTGVRVALAGATVLAAAAALGMAGIPAASAASAGACVGAHARPHLSGPPVGHTGGFGEPSCHTCHADQVLGAPGGTLQLAGLPERYVPGASYRLTVSLARPGMERAGFQMSVRDARGAQAGTLAPLDDRVRVVVAPTGVQYAQHTEKGAVVALRTAAVTQPVPAPAAAMRPAAAGAPTVSRVAVLGTTRWQVLWRAPDPAPAGDLVVHVAANAANYDDSEFGDFIYLLQRSLRAR